MNPVMGGRFLENKHTLSSGVVIVQNDSVLLVYEKGQWGLPKGGVEFDEPVIQTAVREAKEETGLDVEVRGLAFVTEFRKTEWGEHHLQVYFEAEVAGGSLLPNDPDRLVVEARFISIHSLREYLKFPPRIIPLEQWLIDRTPRYHFFDLDIQTEDI